MTLISKLFSKKSGSAATAGTKNKQSQQDVAQLEQMSSDEIAELAGDKHGGCEPALRVAAIGKLGYGSVLLELAVGEQSAKIQQAARERIAHLLDHEQLAFDTLNADVGDKVMLLAVIAFSEHAGLQQQVISHADDEQLLRVALEGVSANLRKSAAERINKRETLEALLKKVKGKDKTIYRIAKQKYEAYKQRDKRQHELEQTMETLCTAMQKLSTRAYDPLFSANFNHLKEQWQHLIEQQEVAIPEAINQRYNQALIACEAIVVEQLKAQQELEQKQQVIANAAAERDDILEALRQLLTSVYALEQLSEQFQQHTGEQLAKQRQRWQAVLEHVGADAQQQQQFDALCDAVLAVQAQIEQLGPLSQQLASLTVGHVSGKVASGEGQASKDKSSADKASADKASADKASADKASADKASADKASADKASADKVSADKPSADKPSADKASADKPSADKPSADKPSTDKSSADKTASSDDTAGNIAQGAGRNTTTPESAESSPEPLTNESTRRDRLPDAEYTESEHSQQSEAQHTSKCAQDIDRSVIKQLRERLHATHLLAAEKLPETVVAAKQLISSWEEHWQQEKQRTQQLQRQLAGLIRRAGDAIARGHVRQAVGIRRSIDEKLAHLHQLPSGLKEQLENLNEKLDQLQDWRSYAVEPKMQELVTQMRELVDSQLNPDTLAEKIKDLQERWKQLSKGAGNQYQQLWDQFHELAQTAYEPCKEYFKHQADIRQQNLQRRKQLVTQLQDFFSHYDWDNADWKLVEKMARVARQEWREYSPTERAATKPVQQAFDEQLALINEYLDVEYQKNAQQKQLLVEQARLLADGEDSRSGVEQVKKLQAKWKAVGVTERKTDQSLWKQFRAQCDAVFEKRHQQSEQYKSQLNETKQQAQALCDEVLALSALSGKELLDARADVERLQAQFAQLGPLPKSNASAIKQKFIAAVGQFEAGIDMQRKQAKEKVWENLFAASAAVAAYHLALQQSDEPGEQLLHTVQDTIDAITQWPKGGREAIQSKLAAVDAASPIDFDANELALRLLCVRMEILADVETPSSDQALRMDYQVKRLQHGFGQKCLSPEHAMTDLVMQWVNVAPVSEACYEPLFKRFNQARKKLL